MIQFKKGGFRKLKALTNPQNLILCVFLAPKGAKWEGLKFSFKSKKEEIIFNRTMRRFVETPKVEQTEYPDKDMYYFYYGMPADELNKTKLISDFMISMSKEHPGFICYAYEDFKEKTGFFIEKRKLVPVS